MADKLSLTQRLSLMFALVASAVLLALGLFIARSVERHFEELDMATLSGKIRLTQEALQALASTDDWMQLQAQLSQSMIGHSGLELMVMEPDGTVLFATEHGQFDVRTVSAQAAQNPLRPVLLTVNGHLYRTAAAWLETRRVDDNGLPQRLLAVVASDTAAHQVYVRSILQTLWIFVFCAAALTGILGWFVVRRELAPLAMMREKARVVTAERLGYRLPVDSVPQELAELAQSLNDMLERLEDAFKRLSDFSGDLAHELRTPVSNLMTQTQVALSRARSAQDYRDVLESNAEEFEHMGRMIADMLLLAKADNGLVVPNREPVDLAVEVQALFDFYEALADEKDLRLQCVGSASVHADRLMLRRAIANLLSNAIRYAGSGSAVQISLAETAEQVQIAVQNTGETIAPEWLERIFDRFFRVDPARQRSSDGTGLGLAITRSIVMAHGGSIAATSAGGLTTLTIGLPRGLVEAGFGCTT